MVESSAKLGLELLRRKAHKILQACYAAQKTVNTQNDRELSPVPFKYIAAVECISKYAKFIDRSDKGKLNKINDG